MNQDEQQLRLLSIFHYVCAGMVAVFACLPIFHLVFGLIMVFHPQGFGPAKDQPPAFFGWFFIGVATMFIMIGWTLAALLAWAGRCLNRHVHYTFCFIAACLACLFMPFGTALGVFTILVLMRPSVKVIFGTRAQPSVAA